MGSHKSDSAASGSIYLGGGRWVSIPIGSPQRPLTDDQVREARAILDRAEREVRG